jgi:hypothetical protein
LVLLEKQYTRRYWQYKLEQGSLAMQFTVLEEM